MIGLFFVFIDECFWQVKNSSVGIAYTLGEISWPLINALIEDITKNEIAIEKSKLDLLKMLAKDRNAYNLFDIPIVLSEKIIGTEDPIMAMVISIPIEVKAGFETGDKMGFYFDGCLGEDQELERSEYYEWELKEWGRLSGNAPVDGGEMVLVEDGMFMMGDENAETYRLKDYPKNTGYRLPTEAEWEYAARGGKYSRGYRYCGSNILAEVGWFWKNSGDRILEGIDDDDRDYDAVVANNCNAQEVGQKPPNELGIYDMSGNVWECCHDWYGDYSSTKKTNPTGPAGPDSASHRVRRGGGWAQEAVFCRVASRFIGKPDGTGGVGLRNTRTGD